jgi:hypothetical protein
MEISSSDIDPKSHAFTATRLQQLLLLMRSSHADDVQAYDKTGESETKSVRATFASLPPRDKIGFGQHPLTR